MTGLWSTDWATGDIVTASEFRKSLGCVADSTLGVAAASFDFTGLPTTYAHLMIECYLRGDTAAVDTSAQLRLNNDSSALYDFQRIVANNATITANASVGQTSSLSLVLAPAASAPASEFGLVRFFIANYAGTTGYKVVQAFSMWQEGTTAATTAVNQGGCRYKSATAVSRATILPAAGNWAAGSRCSVYVMGS